MSDKPETSLALTASKDLLPAMSIPDMISLGGVFDTCGIFGVTQPGQGLVIAMTCLTERISPLQFSRTYHIIENKVSMRADAMLAGFLKAGGTYQIIQRDSECAKVRMKLGDRDAEFCFSHDDAKSEPFYFKKDGKTPKDNYATPRKRMQMLWARVVSDGVRTIAPDVVAGVYTPEEVGDFEKIVAGESRRLPPEPIAAEPEPVAEVIPANQCPVPGPMFKKPWAEVPDNTLAFIAERAGKLAHKGVTPEHDAAVAAEVARRAEEKKAGAS